MILFNSLSKLASHLQRSHKHFAFNNHFSGKHAKAQRCPLSVTQLYCQVVTVSDRNHPIS